MEKSEIQKIKHNKKGVIKTTLKVIILVIVVVSAVAVTFINEYYPKYSAEYKEHFKKYNVLIDERNTGFEDVIQKLEQGTDNEKALAAEYRQIAEKSKADLKEYHNVKNQLLEDQKVIGYTSFKNFLLGFGIRFFAFIVCLFFFYKVIKTKGHKNKKRWEISIAATFLLCASYWVSWSFLFKVNTKGEYDFERFMYDFALYGLPILVVIASYFIFKYKKTSEEKYREARLNHILDVRDFLDKLTNKFSKLINLNKRTEFLEEKDDTINNIRLK